MIKKTFYISPKEEILMDGKKLYRQASRAIIIRDSLILMVYSKVNKDYKFPGGGIEKGETKIDAVVREVLEEVGRTITNIKSQFAFITTINKETIRNEYDYFQMDSHYFFCEINNKLSKQNLSQYEADLCFIPKWVTIEKAIQTNENVLKGHNIPRWTLRETRVLKMLRNMIG
ncbi:MAG: NUDIX domain-containing protein [Tenericutes bacterium]|jgi:8-oxo-dGTP pyrophosphatase MutT (NUDIX family)|nr:NUDIX domain-containing protein [Mycoplasmatota bacterium]